MGAQTKMLKEHFKSLKTVNTPNISGPFFSDFFVVLLCMNDTISGDMD